MLTRRQFIGSTLTATLAGQQSKAANGKRNSMVEVYESRTISLDSEKYHGWPTLLREKNGTLTVVCSGGRESHICPFGRVDMIRSFDDGKNWTYSRTILDGPIDDRDAGIVETSKGTLLVSTFTSLAYTPTLTKAIRTSTDKQPVFSAERLRKWQGAHDRLADGQHESHLGCWLIRSTDQGLNWSPAYRVPVNSPHGPINLQDGRLLYPGVALWTRDRKVLVCDSADDGLSWNTLSEIPTRPGDDHRNYHELHGVEAHDGRLIVQIRNHNSQNNRETLQTHSVDGGKTWATPYGIDTWGLPSHLLRLQDNRLLMTYGHRRAPIGNQIRLSDDNGQSWSQPQVLYGDGVSTDLGYPSTIELPSGELITVWYERMPESPLAQLRMSRWSLNL